MMGICTIASAQSFDPCSEFLDSCRSQYKVLKIYQAEIVSTIRKMQADFKAKYNAFLAIESKLDPRTREARRKELKIMESQIASFEHKAMSELIKRQIELNQIIEKNTPPKD